MIEFNGCGLIEEIYKILFLDLEEGLFCREGF